MPIARRWKAFWLGLPWWITPCPWPWPGRGDAALLRRARPCSCRPWRGLSHRAFLALGRRFAGRFWPGMAEELLGGGLVADAGPEGFLAALGGRVADCCGGPRTPVFGTASAFCPTIHPMRVRPGAHARRSRRYFASLNHAARPLPIFSIRGVWCLRPPAAGASSPLFPLHLPQPHAVRWVAGQAEGVCGGRAPGNCPGAIWRIS